MTALFFRPVATYPVRCGAPAFFARPSFPTPADVAPLFSLLDESFAQLDNARRQSRRQLKRPFNPRFDVKETQEAYSVEGELPGFDAKDISIEFLDDGHTLQIKGKTVKEIQKAVDGDHTEAAKSLEQAPAAQQTSEASSVKSHQATVEDEVEEPANASAANEQSNTQEQIVSESSSGPTDQQVTEQQQPTHEAKNWISERYTGSFTRSFQFPSKVNQEAVKASLKDGILAITLPFASKPESRKIQIE